MRGPSLDLTTLSINHPMDCGLRIILAYHVQTDMIIFRFDAKIQDRQYTTGFLSSTPILPKPREMFNPYDDMITPSKGVDACINVKGNKQEILRALKELVNDIETDIKETISIPLHEER